MFKRMSLSAKLISGFLTVAAIAVVIGTVGSLGLRFAKAEIRAVGEKQLPSVQHVLTISNCLVRIQMAMRTVMNPNLGKEDRAKEYEAMAQAREVYAREVAAYEGLALTPEERQQWEQFKQSLVTAKTENVAFTNLVQQMEAMDIVNPPALGMAINGFVADYYALNERVGALVQRQQAFEGGDDPALSAFGAWSAGFHTNNQAIDGVLKTMAEPHRQVHALVKQIKTLVQSGNVEEAAKVHAQMQTPLGAMREGFDRLLTEVAKASKVSEQAIVQAFGPCAQQQSICNGTLAQIADNTQKNVAQVIEAAGASATRNSAIMLISLVIGVVVSVVLGIFLSLGITRPVNRIIAGLTAGAEQVAAASGQVSAASQALAQGATEQAAGLEETSASLEEMASQTRQNADNAQQANVLAGDAKKVTVTGVESMRRMNIAIQEIQKSSDETAKIIKVIDEIAFQTNLLALNAAVEAARAGEAGKGFAVVAEEVRNLAMRSAEAAKNTAGMIEESVKNSKNGVDIANDVAKALEEIVQNTGKVTDLVGEIAAASQEQAQGIDQVNTAVSQMDKVTQQNAANAEESASASEELSAQAESMTEIVGELVAMVGGVKSRAARSQDAGTERHPIARKLEHAVPSTAKAKTHAFGKSDELLHEIANRPATSRPAAAAKLIPLSDSEENLHDFNA
ncbi:MAG: MCP four helix bundle domain-containing protein [Phycisphaerae bacterium]|nr:MCP four helix bundle domain-containing protein [Phycisphaerae bacterium]